MSLGGRAGKGDVGVVGSWPGKTGGGGIRVIMGPVYEDGGNGDCCDMREG